MQQLWNEWLQSPHTTVRGKRRTTMKKSVLIIDPIVVQIQMLNDNAAAFFDSMFSVLCFSVVMFGNLHL